MHTLSIILPVYNEKETIEEVLREWKKELGNVALTYVFIICEDGSTDGTKELLKKIQKKYPIVMCQESFRRGYGTAVIDGIAKATSDFILCIDSDGQCDPHDFQTFWNKKSNRHILIGWRKDRADAKQRKVISGLFKTVFDFLFPSNIHDPSAPFVLFHKKSVTPHMNYLSFLTEGFWWGFVGMCIKKNIPLFELPINHRKRLKGDTQVYKLSKIPGIALRNLHGLFRLKTAK